MFYIALMRIHDQFHHKECTTEEELLQFKVDALKKVYVEFIGVYNTLSHNLSLDSKYLDKDNAVNKKYLDLRELENYVELVYKFIPVSFASITNLEEGLYVEC